MSEPRFTIVDSFEHNGRYWRVVSLAGSGQFFARDDADNDTGPYSTWQQARDWVLEIAP
jgi:hypothetical protein